jgi:hypothetical protein
MIGPNILFGDVVIPAAKLLTSEHTSCSKEPLVKERHASFVNGALSFEIQLTQIDMDDVEHLPSAIPHTYFPLRRNCRVTFYQDAHQIPGGIQCVPLATCADMPYPVALQTFASLPEYAAPCNCVFVQCP